jgi:hypothetical protein
MEQVYLFNLLMNHEAQNQQNQDANQQLLDSLMPPSQLPMDLRKEERRSKSHKRDLPKIDLNGWDITCTDFPSHAKRLSNTVDTTTCDHGAHLSYNCKQPGHFVKKCLKPSQGKTNRTKKKRCKRLRTQAQKSMPKFTTTVNPSKRAPTTTGASHIRQHSSPTFVSSNLVSNLGTRFLLRGVDCNTPGVY